MYRLLIVIFLSSLFALTACESDFSAVPSLGDLRWTADTLSFDTIFVQTTTPTAHFTLRNKSDKDMTIEEIRLLGGDSSPFMVNINGTDASSVSGIHLRADDSLMVFVAVRPFSISNGDATHTLTDMVEAVSGDNRWTTVLTATIQNLLPLSGTLTSDTFLSQDSIPYYVTDSLIVPSGIKLSIADGVTLLFEDNATLYIDGGSLSLEGNKHRNVTLRQKRTDGFYAKIPGQWHGISLHNATAYFSDTELACCRSCVVADSSSVVADGLLIRDASKDGFSLDHSSLSLSNSIIVDCGSHSIFQLGGDVELNHVTFSDYYSWDYRRTPTLKVLPVDSTESFKLRITNSIIMGSLSDEIELDSVIIGDSFLSHSLLRCSDNKKLLADSTFFINCPNPTNAEFVDRRNRDFHLLPKSLGFQAADTTAAMFFPIDFEGNPRYLSNRPCIGALESKSE